MRRTGQGPAHYEVELRQADRRNERTGTARRPVRRVGLDGAMSPLTFVNLQTAQAYAKRMNRQEART